MHILFTTHQGGIAGSTFSIFYLANGLAARGHEVHIACSKDSYLHKLISGTKIIHHNISFRGYFDWRSARKLAGVAKSCQIDIINPQSGRDRTLAIQAKWFLGTKSVLVFTRRQRPRSEPRVKRWLLLLVAKRIVVVSEGLREMFLDKGYPGARMVTIDNGVPTDLPQRIDEARVMSLRRELQITGQVVGCVARLKKQEQLIKALTEIPPDVTVLFVGIEEDQLQEAIWKHRPRQRLIFTGRLPGNEALHYFKLLDVNILPSVMDGFGLVLVESMLLGIPVIGTNRGGIKSVIEHEKSGLLFEDGDTHQLAAHVNRLLTDRSFREKIISNGFERAKHFSIEKTIANYETFFQSLLP